MKTNHNKIFIGAILIVICIMVLVGILAIDARADDTDGPIWTNKMIALHEAADLLRAAGYSDDDPLITALSDAWWDEFHDFQIVAKVIEGEAGGCDFEQMVYTGVTVVNRKNSDLFPNTIYEVVAAPGQYSPIYLKNFHTIQPRVWLAAKAVMDGDHDAPDDLYWEALFPQGREIWKIITFQSRWYCSTTYFCRGTIYD